MYVNMDGHIIPSIKPSTLRHATTICTDCDSECAAMKGVRRVKVDLESSFWVVYVGKLYSM